MPPSGNLNRVLEEARKLVSLPDDERESLKRTLGASISKIRAVVDGMGLDAEVTPVGSAVRDTWLPGNYELDIFVLFPKEAGDKYALGELIKEIAKRTFRNFRQNYAEHPYVIVKYEGFDIDLVPAYKIRKGERVVSSVDRTPFHSSYVLSKLKSPEEVRLLKAFLKSINAYGAEERIGGFSGYLCELLVIFYGSFLDTIINASKWRPPVYIDPEMHLSEEYALSIFQDPLIVIDPVDPRRNVAAALTLTQFNRFRVAARAFLINPNLEFFKRGLKHEKKRTKASVIEKELKRRGSHLIAVELNGLNDLSRELLWSQSKKLAKIFKDELFRYGFQPIWVAGWTDGSSIIVVAGEVPHLKLSSLEKKIGPPVGIKDEEKFLRKYVLGEDTFGGPFIEDDRWYVYSRRGYTEVSMLLSDFLRGNKMPSLLRGRANVRILSEKEIESLSQWALNEIWEELFKEEFFVKYLVKR